MSGGPQNAEINADGFRLYEWIDAETQITTHVLLSVTSIRHLCGEGYQLVRWQLANLANAATGMTKREWLGPRGGKHQGYFPDGWDPADPDDRPEFMRMIEAASSTSDLDRARDWLMTTAEQPRDTAALRGTIVHESIELNIQTDRIDQDYLESAVLRLSKRDRVKAETHAFGNDDDLDFVRRANANYWDMRERVPFVVLAKEPQVWNLEHGFAGSADVLIWFLGHFAMTEVGDDEAGDVYTFVPLPNITDKERAAWQKKADRGQVTQADIERVGGVTVLGDWKTAAGVYSDNVIQVHAYLAAEFVGSDGVRDERLTAILAAMSNAAIIHIRPEKWTIHFVPFSIPTLRAFLGSVALARFLAAHKSPVELFSHEVQGAA